MSARCILLRFPLTENYRRLRSHSCDERWSCTFYANSFCLLMNPASPCSIPMVGYEVGDTVDNTRHHIAVATQHALKSIDMLNWPAGSPDLSVVLRVWDINGRQLQHPSEPALIVPLLTQQYYNELWKLHQLLM
ncbi:hypothetical protein TNCV_3647231 [Trichonephila clavipes]|nr:hypothetical protein TNCV_3647231 [Trichonephila clavipes]